MRHSRVNPAHAHHYTNEQKLVLAVIHAANDDLPVSKYRYSALCFFASEKYRRWLEYLGLNPALLPAWLETRVKAGQIAWPPGNGIGEVTRPPQEAA
jgi:hypothetical protein